MSSAMIPSQDRDSSPSDDELGFIFNSNACMMPQINDRRLNTPPPLIPNQSDGVASKPFVESDKSDQSTAQSIKSTPILRLRPRDGRKQTKFPNTVPDSDLDELLGNNSISTVRKKRTKKASCLPPTTLYKEALIGPVNYNPFYNWCAVCGVVYAFDNGCVSGCPVHKVKHVRDADIPSRARLSLPACLKLKSITSDLDDNIGNSLTTSVHAKTLIDRQTRFGPYSAPLCQDADPIFPLRIDHLNVIDQSTYDYVGSWYLSPGNEDMCNWMMFVRPAENLWQQNLIVYQSGYSLYFETVRSIKPNEELRVWYSPYYALTLNKRMLPSVSQSPTVDLDDDCESKTSAVPDTNDATSSRSAKLYRQRVFNEEMYGSSTRDEVHCSLCRLTFASDNSLQIHKLLHPGEIAERKLSEESLKRASECAVCLEEFDDLVSLAEHIVEHSIVEPKYFPSTLRSSIVQSSVFELTYACGQCGSKFNNLYEFQEHKTANHSRSVPKPFISLNKEKISSNQYNDADRVQNSNCEPSSNVSTCPYCKMVFKSKNGFKTHVKSHNEEYFYKCMVCDLSLFSAAKLRSHIKNHAVVNELGVAEYPCHKCNRTYSLYAKLATHIRQVHSKRILLCPYCPKSFSRSFKLEEHIRVHTGDRPFTCSFCSKGFSRKDKLNCHMKTKHSESTRNQDKRQKKRIMSILTENQFVPSPPPSNDHCLDIFQRSEEHIRSSNQSSVLYTYCETQNLFSCRQCGFKCRRRGILLNHMTKLHPHIPKVKFDQLKKKPTPACRQSVNFICNYCHEKFKSNSKRRDHIFRCHPHESVNNFPNQGSSPPYECSICTRQFRSDYKLKSHMRWRHPDCNQTSVANCQLVETEPNQAAVEIIGLTADSETNEMPTSSGNLILTNSQPSNVDFHPHIVDLGASSILYSGVKLEGENSESMICSSQPNLTQSLTLTPCNSNITPSVVNNYDPESSDWSTNYQVVTLTNWQNTPNEQLLEQSFIPQIVEVTDLGQSNGEIAQQFNYDDYNLIMDPSSEQKHWSVID